MHGVSSQFDVHMTLLHFLQRQQCVPLLLDLISCFMDTGRHRIYRSTVQVLPVAWFAGNGGASEAPLRTILEADYVLSFRSLFHSVDHAGVLGLLIHNIKNEVDRALKVQVVLVLYSVLVVQCNFLNFKSRTYYLPHISLCLQRQSLPTVHSLVLT